MLSRKKDAGNGTAGAKSAREQAAEEKKRLEAEAKKDSGTSSTYRRDRIIVAILSILVGLLFVAIPGRLLSVISQVVGIFFIAAGIVSIVLFFLHREKAVTSSFILVFGLIVGAIGIWICLNPAFLITLIPRIIGALFLFAAIIMLSETLTLIRRRYSFWWISLIASLVTLAAGIVLLVRAYEISEMFTRIIGLIFIFSGATSIWIISRIGYVIRGAELREAAMRAEAEAAQAAAAQAAADAELLQIPESSPGGHGHDSTGLARRKKDPFASNMASPVHTEDSEAEGSAAGAGTGSGTGNYADAGAQSAQDTAAEGEGLVPVGGVVDRSEEIRKE